MKLNDDFLGGFFNRKQNAAVVLTKDSGKEQIKQYFTQVCKLHDGGNEFPIDLDTVWPLVYSRKDKAVRALLDNEMFQEGIDFQVLPQNGEKGRPTEKYILNVNCMEYFVARKERTVFEVYRQVFHAARKQAALPSEDRVANMLIDNLTPVLKSFEVIARSLNERMDRLEEQKRPGKGVSITHTLGKGRISKEDIYTVNWQRETYFLLTDVLAYFGSRTKACVVAQSLNRNGVDHAIMLSAYRRNQPAWFVNREGLEMLEMSRRFSNFHPKSGKSRLHSEI